METNQLRLAVYTGSFDPITLGHLNVIRRACRLVDKLIVGVGINIEKQPLFTADERVAMIHRVIAGEHNAEVRTFTGLAVEFVRECRAKVMIRGIRPLTDVAAEFTMLLANRHLADDVETIFLMADEELAHVSSSLIKQITPVTPDAMLARFVPAAIIPDIRAKIPGPNGGMTRDP
ncbi:MAG: pantetheine-phosphate adenylyltransferase [Pirellulaceae bacterium]|jgi:pantetheine-phosphate adenylyltransferase|nr:pantetheine-phosphate adenylyltransferase [Pirellulaceae bacterium]